MSACTFCGHADTSDKLRLTLHIATEKMIRKNDVIDFYVVTNRNFDRMATQVLHEHKKQYPQINYHIVLAYMPSTRSENSLYKGIETLHPDGLETVPLHYAIVHRNRWMVEHSQYIISYVTHGCGGAAETLKYATARKLEVVSLI